MFLGGKKIKNVGYEHPLFRFPAPKELKDKELLDALRKGDPDAPDLIAKSFMRLVLTVVGRYFARLHIKDDELVSTALLGMCKAIKEAPEAMRDDNLGGYIILRVHREIYRFLKKERRHERLDENTLEMADTIFNAEDWIQDVSSNETEINILRFRSLGWRNSEIADRLGVSRAYISKVWSRFKERYENERHAEMGGKLRETDPQSATGRVDTSTVG